MPNVDSIFPESFSKKSWKWLISEEDLKEIEELEEKYEKDEED